MRIRHTEMRIHCKCIYNFLYLRVAHPRNYTHVCGDGAIKIDRTSYFIFIVKLVCSWNWRVGVCKSVKNIITT